MKEVEDFISKCGVYYLATVENNIPKVRPFGTLAEFEGKLYILTGKKKDVSKQIEKNPNVEICACLGETWMRLSGQLVRDDRVKAKKNMLDKNPHLRTAYDEHDENTEVLYFKDATAVFYSFTEQPKVFKL
jgi:uncharacterized pyridoxamine 5'-phosphate oxidase family protein